MPNIEEHVKISLARTGKDYAQIHEWMDKDPGKKAERHDVSRICEFGSIIRAKYGEEGLNEYVQHIYDDVIARYMRGKEIIGTAISASLAHHELTTLKQDEANGVCRMRPSDIDLLIQAGLATRDLEHSIHVAQKALEIAERTGSDLDMDLVGRGALLHDLGKGKSKGIDHGKAGAELGVTLGLPESITIIMEKHVNAGLTEDEARELGLPSKDYSPSRLEEKIVIYSDKLVDIISHPDRIVDSEIEAEHRFKEILEQYPKLAKSEKAFQRHLAYHEEIQRLIKRATQRGEHRPDS